MAGLVVLERENRMGEVDSEFYLSETDAYRKMIDCVQDDISGDGDVIIDVAFHDEATHPQDGVGCLQIIRVSTGETYKLLDMTHDGDNNE